MDVHKSKRENNYQSRLLHAAKLSTTIGGERKTYHDATKCQQYLTTKPALQRVVEEKFQPEEVKNT